MRSKDDALKKEHHLRQRTRRQFLRDGTVAAAGAWMIQSAGSLVAAPLKAVPLEQISFGSFAALQNTVFRVQGEGATTPLELVEARMVGSHPNSSPDAPDAQNEKFALLFAGSLAQPLTQNTYWFEQPRLGRFAMFIAPIGREDPSRLYYEAIFNRPQPGTASRGSLRGSVRGQLR
jgi:hypothetical protein